MGLFSPAVLLLAGGKIVKEKLEPKVTQPRYFDWDAYWSDVKNGMSTMEQLEKRKRGEYYTNVKPKKEEKDKLPMRAIVDVERYERDRNFTTSTPLKTMRELGEYSYFVHK